MNLHDNVDNTMYNVICNSKYHKNVCSSAPPGRTYKYIKIYFVQYLARN